MLDSRVCITVDGGTISIKYQDVSVLDVVEILERLLFVSRAYLTISKPLFSEKVKLVLEPNFPGDKKICIAFDGKEKIHANSSGLTEWETTCALQWASTYMQAVLLGLKE